MSPRPATAEARGAAAAPSRPAERRTRPSLRVVDPSELRRLRPGRVGTTAGAVLFVALFALAAFQTVIIKAQGHLDDVNKRIDAQELRQRDLSLSLAELRSPERITAAARERLGMIAPGEITYLQPGAGDDDAAAIDPSATPTTTTPPAPTTTVAPKKTTPSTSTPTTADPKKTTTSTTAPKPNTTSTTAPKKSTTSTTTGSTGR